MADRLFKTQPSRWSSEPKVHFAKRIKNDLSGRYWVWTARCAAREYHGDMLPEGSTEEVTCKACLKSASRGAPASSTPSA